MPSINHKIGTTGVIEKIYTALSTDQGLSSWWTAKTKGAGPIGSKIAFDFDGHIVEMEVTELESNKKVKWKCLSGPTEWVGTQLSFFIKPSGKQNFIFFTHTDWKEATDFMSHCNTKWAVFLLSLKDYLETGTGKPFPKDLQIDHS